MMNKLIRASLHFFSSSLLIIAGCGPQPISEAEFVAENTHNHLQGAGLHKEGGDASVPLASDACPAGQCEVLPDPDTKKIVQLPDQVEVLPTKIIHTSENQVATDVVDYHITRHIWQPVEVHHTVNEHRNILRRFFTTIVFH